MAELCEHEKEPWNPLTQNLVSSHISLCREESAGCSSSSNDGNGGGGDGGNINISCYLGMRILY